MNNRPSRRAKQRAIQVLQETNTEIYSTSDVGVDEDDVAFERSEVTISDESGVSVLSESDYALFEDEVQNLSLTSENESTDFEEENAASHHRSLLSPSEVQWQFTRPAGGREPRANIFTCRSGFLPGLRPANETEAFMSLFNELVQTALLYTNKSGKRSARTPAVTWKFVTKEEMLAFIGEFL